MHDELREAHRAYRETKARHNTARLHLNKLIHEAAETMTLQEIADMTGRSRQAVHKIIVEQRRK